MMRSKRALTIQITYRSSEAFTYVRSSQVLAHPREIGPFSVLTSEPL